VNTKRPEASPARAIDRLLRQSLRPGQGGPVAGACLEPDTLAAWIEGSLRGEELAAAESHSAGCERCQAMLAAMVQLEPATAPRQWWQTLTARWLVPVAAAATAAALWVAVAPDQLPRENVPPSEAASARSSAAPASPAANAEPAPETPAPSTSPASSMAPTSADAGKRSAVLDRAQPSDAKKTRIATTSVTAAEKLTEDLAARRDRAEDADRAADSFRVARQEAPAGPPPPPPPPAAPGAGLKPQEKSAGPPPPDSASIAGNLKRPESPPAPAPAAQPIGQARAQSAPGRAAFTAPVTSVDVVSPDPSIRWRAGGGGIVQRSTDRGVTWVAQETGTSRDVTAGSSPAPDVCWLAGRGGVVLLTIDGKTWRQRPFPEPVDLVAVSATDAKTATVTTSDGRRFSTTDGGATWSRTFLQENPPAPFYQ
jgi:hypothetical protein